MRALGLYCLLEGIPIPEGQLAALRAGLIWQGPQAPDDAASGELAIRATAAKALCDWMLLRWEYCYAITLRCLDMCQCD